MPRRAQPHADIRTFGLTGHRSSGKTTLAEMLLHTGGALRRQGRVEQGTALLDQEPLEKSRRLGLVPALGWVSWGEHELYFVDTPGTDHVRWVRKHAMNGVDLSVVVVSSTGGVERGAERALRGTRHADRSSMVVLSKIERPYDHKVLMHDVAAAAGVRVVPLQLAWWEDDCLVGLVDVLRLVGLRYATDGSGSFEETDLPAHLVAEAHAAREEAFEAATLADDALLESYLEYLELPVDDAWRGLHMAAAQGKVLPLLLSAAILGIGGAPILDAVSRLAPKPDAWVMPAGVHGTPRFVAQWVATRLDEHDEPVTYFRVWHGSVSANASWRNARTGEVVRLRKLYRVRGHRRSTLQCASPGALVAVWGRVPGLLGDTFSDDVSLPLRAEKPPDPMTWLWVKVRNPHHHERLMEALERLHVMDPSLRYTEEFYAGGVRLHGITRGQLDLAVVRLQERFELDISTDLPPVKYLERPLTAVRDVHGLYCKMRGEEVSEYGECWIDVCPSPPELGFQYLADVDEEILPTRFVAPIGEGARRALAHGPTGGYPVSGVVVRCERGEYDILESTEAHFEEAGERAMVSALTEVGTELFEPWSELRVFCPSEDLGAVLADLSAHRGRVVGLEVHEVETTVQVQVPDRELRTQASRLEAITGGRAWFVNRPSHYDRLPDEFVGEAIAASPFSDVVMSTQAMFARHGET